MSSLQITGLRVPKVALKIGASERTVWHLSKTDPNFPKPIRLTSKLTVWREDELDEWIAKRAAASR
ncbi:helix-turn-helix transcriptional regulator [Burkholderia ubonensis]|uniref:helix-turn-helix transcriptional regulator n=1 Tax=Burkholderia ubonensis TaxID=101571 RepID=UPI002ABE0817|nr:AlpA family phage regulatory protein [Burkholderia ubonensis]